MKLYAYIPFQRPSKENRRNKQNICYLQYIHKVQGGTSNNHAFKIVVQKNNYHFYRIHASKTESFNIIVVQHSIPIDDAIVCIISSMERFHFLCFILSRSKNQGACQGALQLSVSNFKCSDLQVSECLQVSSHACVHLEWKKKIVKVCVSV